jgi:hypothetical protein
MIRTRLLGISFLVSLTWSGAAAAQVPMKYLSLLDVLTKAYADVAYFDEATVCLMSAARATKEADYATDSAERIRFRKIASRAQSCVRTNKKLAATGRALSDRCDLVLGVLKETAGAPKGSDAEKQAKLADIAADKCIRQLSDWTKTINGQRAEIEAIGEAL